MKNLSKTAVERPVTFLMVSLILIGFGFYGLSNLRLNLYPDVTFPTITVYTVYEGVAPEDMETLISRPIEEAVGSVSGIRRVRSLSSQGASVVRLNFDWGIDLFVAETEVRKRLDQIRRSIPVDAEQPIVFSYDPNDEPIVVLTLTSPVRSPRDLRTIATQQLEQRIERINGVASANTAGGLERQINIQISNAQMRAYDLDVATIGNRLRADNIQVPAGQLSEGQTTYALRTVGEFKNVEQIRNTIIATRDGNPIYLKDVASVEDGIAQPIGNVRVQGNDGVILNIYKTSDTNIVAAAGSIIDGLDALRATLPSDVQLEVLSNKADFIRMSINNLVMTAVQAIILVMLMLLIFLRSGRSSLIVAVSIPVSIITTFSIMNWANVSLNIISLSGLTLAVGLVVDNAVVVLENIFRFKEEGEDTKSAAVKGAQEVTSPVVMSTLTTLVVFLPVLFVPGIAGLLFRDLALTISFALIVSVLVALTLIPVMGSRLFARDDARKNLDTPPKPSRGFLKTKVVPALTRMFDRLENSYNRTLDKLLPKSGIVVTVSFLFLLATLPIFYLLGGEFFPEVDENRIVLEIQREPGVNLFELERTILMAENIIGREVPEARLVVSDYGDKIGIQGADNPGGNQGIIRIELTPVSERSRDQFQITASLLRALEILPSTNVRELREDPLSPDGETGLIVQIYGFDPEIRSELAVIAADRMRNTEGIASVFSQIDEGRPELRIQMDRERIARVGLTTSQVANAVSNAVKGDMATTFVDQGVEFQVLVQVDPIERSESTSLQQIQIRAQDGTWMPLSNLARIERVTGPSSIIRIDQERMVEIEADLDGIDIKTATDRTRASLDQITWPEGYRYEVAGAAEDQRRSFQYLLIAFVIAGILTYMVMASQFESLVEPFIIILTIPLALSGVLIILWATGTAISVTAMVGLVLLTGIVVNNGIVMIDYIKILQSRGLDRHKAIVTGATRRLRPILMTAFTTILAMVPLALQLGSGSETWSPMARTVIGGLTMSTLLMLFAVPCMYFMVNSLVERLGFDSIHKEDPLLDRE
jgi:HAE1 family hydrophobic/amphiphilic exporter-1